MNLSSRVGTRIHTAGTVRWAMLALLVVIAACAPAEDPGTMSGYAEADLVYIAPATSGVLRELTVRRGDAVAAGQKLFALEADAETLAHDAAQARRDSAEAQLRNLQKGRRPAELQTIDQQQAQAAAALAASTATLERNRQLVTQGFQSAARLDELVAARDRDAARVRELQAQRRLAVQAARGDEIDAASAAARAVEAEAALAGWRESQRQRTAPVAARVHDVLFRPGEWVNAGAPVVALLPPAGLKLRFFVPEPLLAQAQPGREVLVQCDGCAAGLRARIRFVSSQAEYTPPVIYSNQSRHKLVYLAEAEPTDPTAFRPGQPVDVRFAPAAAR